MMELELFPEHTARARISALIAASEHFVEWAVRERQEGAWRASWTIGFVSEHLDAETELDALTGLLARLRRELGARG